MAGAVITISQPTGAGAGTPGVSRDDIWFGQEVQLTDVGGGNTEWSWEILDQPPGASATLNNPTSQTTTLTPTAGVKGTYRIKLVVEGGGPGNEQIRVFRVRFDASGALHKLGVAAPASKEREGEANYVGARDFVGTMEQALYALEEAVINSSGGASSVNATPDTLALRDALGGSKFTSLIATTLDAAAGQLEVGGASTGLLLGSATQTTAVAGSELEVAVPSVLFYTGGLPAMTWALNASGPTSVTFGEGTTVSFLQSQSTSGPGRVMTFRGQRGQAGQVGGDVIWGSGAGGTPGTNAAGWFRIKLGTPVGGATSPFVLEREDGTPVMTTYEIAAGIVGHYFGSAGGSHQGIVRGATLGLESSAGLIAVQPATDLYLGHASNRDIFHRDSGTTVLTEHLDADGETRLRFASGPTSILFDHAQHASGPGVLWRLRAQQGASGQVGGTFEIGVGLGGTAGTNAPGNLRMRLGAQAAGQTGHVLLTDESSGDVDFFRARRVGTATYLEALAGDLILSSTAATQFLATTSMVFRGLSAFLDAATVYHRDNSLSAYYTEVKGVQTLSAAATVTIASFATTTGRMYGAEAFFTFSNNVDDQGGFLIYRASFKNVGGTVTQIEGPAVAVNKFRDAAVSGYDATIDFSGTTIRARFTPDDADSTLVKCVLRVYEVTQS